jgi:hypothetical protein
MQESRRCCVCHKSAAELVPPIKLSRCANPRCRNSVCERHALSYEWVEDEDSQRAAYCSRQCWNEVRQRALPISRELAIAATLIFIVIPLYLYVVSLFT